MRKAFGVILLMLLIYPGCSRSGKHELLLGFALDGYPIEQQRLLELQDRTGIKAELINFYLQWPEKGGKFVLPVSSLEAIHQYGAMPCLTWEPPFIRKDKLAAIHYREVIDHHYDDYMREFAAALKSWGKPLMLRFGHEMNLSEYHWGTSAADYGPESPKVYVEMFQYLVNFFRESGAANVLWVFCPNADSVPNQPWNKASLYYPGDEYVDILGMDGYNWGNEISTSRSFKEIFLPMYTELRSISDNKPIIVFETASAIDQLQWLHEALATAEQWNLMGIIWFQVDKEMLWSLPAP